MLTQPPAKEQRPLGSLLTAVFDKLSHQMAGGQRVAPQDLLPGADDPLEGLVPDEYLAEMAGFDWFDPTVWAQASPENMNLLDLSSIPAASGPGRDGKGLDFFRAGEAPGNYTNRNNPLYQARREFAVAIAPKIEEMFGVSAEGSAGHMRAPSSGDAAPGGRSANSDHYSGGAIDFFGTPDALDALRAWLVDQPFTSFVRWRSESHGGASGTEEGAHLHASFDVGYIAQSYFQGRRVPNLTARSDKQVVEAATESTRAVTGGGMQVL